MPDAQDSDLEYLCWRCKNSPVSSDLKPPLALKKRPNQIGTSVHSPLQKSILANRGVEMTPCEKKSRQ